MLCKLWNIVYRRWMCRSRYESIPFPITYLWQSLQRGLRNRWAIQIQVGSFFTERAVYLSSATRLFALLTSEYYVAVYLLALILFHESRTFVVRHGHPTYCRWWLRHGLQRKRRSRGRNNVNRRSSGSCPWKSLCARCIQQQRLLRRQHIRLHFIQSCDDWRVVEMQWRIWRLLVSLHVQRLTLGERRCGSEARLVAILIIYSILYGLVWSIFDLFSNQDSVNLSINSTLWTDVVCFYVIHSFIPGMTENASGIWTSDTSAENVYCRKTLCDRKLSV